MTTYTSTNSLFQYTITNDTSYVMDDSDYSIIAEAFNLWDSIVTPDSRFTESYTIDVSFYINTLDVGVLGGASVTTATYFTTYSFGNAFPSSGNITMNEIYIDDMKNDLRTSGKSKYYYVLLHEIGHILGIGTFWGIDGSPLTSYVEDEQTKYYYTGENAVREYKSYLPAIADQLVGIPVEDDGGTGTINVHPEEGAEGITSSNSRYINGVFHPGLDTELMTGWLDSTPETTPLSRISLGFLADMGFIVDYDLAESYALADGTWLDLAANAHCLKSTYIDGTLDLSGGDIQLRGVNDSLIVEGDVTFNGSVRLGNKVGFGVETPLYEMDVSGNVYVSESVTSNGDASLNKLTVTGNYTAENGITYSGGSLSGNALYTDTSLDKRLFVRSEDVSYNATINQNIASDLDNAGNFSADINLNDAGTSMTLSNNITIVDTSNNNYGAYTTYTNADGSTYFNVGKSASNIFNIVDNNNTGVYMASDGNSFTSTSDARLKKDIVPLQNPTETLLKLQPCTYKWKTQTDDDNKKHVGFIAQEVEEVLPNLVNENTYPDGSTYKGVAATDLVPYLVSMNNSLDQRIQELKHKINALKSG